MKKTTHAKQRLPQHLRKAPQQQRSQILFNRILLTAKKLFEERGYANVSTNQIAEAANISVGSIYQYFPNCESIALAIYEESSAKAMLLAMRKSLEVNSPLDQAISEIVTTLIEIFDSDRYVLLHLIDEVPELRQTAKIMSFDNLAKRAVQTYLQQHFPNASQADIQRKAYITEKCIVGLIRNYLDEEPDMMTRADLVGELSAMTRLYLEHTLAIPANAKIRKR